MNSLARCFNQLRNENRKALIPYLTVGDPDLNFTYSAALHCLQGGADILELGIPFSDPLADGPTIQKAAKRALASGTTFNGVLQLVIRLRNATQAPIVLLCYYNTICCRGELAFATACAQAGVNGLIVADLPYNEANNMASCAASVGLNLIPLVAPNSTDEHITKAASVASGFIYCVSVKGVTGARTQLPDTLNTFITKVRAHTNTPLAVGFGIAQPRQAVQVAAIADGIIVGSALIDLLATQHNAQIAQTFMANFRYALDSEYHI